MAVAVFSLASFVLLVVFLSLFLGTLFKKQTSLMVPLGMCGTVSLNCVTGQLGAFFGIIVGVEVISAINLLLAIALFFAKKALIARGCKGGQKCVSNKTFNCFIWISYLIIAIFVVVCGSIQFGQELNPNYASTDAAAHFWSSMQIAFGKSVPSGMFLTHYETALWIQAFAPMIEYYQLFKVFIVVDLCFLLVVGWLFFSATQLLNKPISKPLAVVVSILCIAGYPLNNTVFGFSYLGAGVMYCFAFALVLFLSQQAKQKKAAVVLLVLFLYSTLICYNLFILVEIVFIAVAFLAHLKNKGWGNKKIVILIVLFVLLCIAGAAFVLKTGFADGLTADGYIYKDLFWSFVPIFPLAVCGFVQGVKNREAAYSWFALSVMICTIGALVLFLLGRFSAYYYYKFYYVLWIALFFLGAIGLFDLIKRKNVLAIAYSILTVILLCVTVTGFDMKIYQKFPSLNLVTEQSPSFGVYVFNYSQMKSESISSEEIELFEKGAEYAQPDEYIPMIGTNIDVYWHEAITQVRNDNRRYYYYWLYGGENPQAELIDRLSNAQHLIVLDGQELSQEMSEYLSNKTVEYRNSAGSLYALN